MAAQFGRAPLAPPPMLAFETSAAAARTLLRSPCNVRLHRTLRRSLDSARVPRRGPFAMTDDAAGAALPFASTQGNLPEILAVESGGPRPVEPGKVPSMTVTPEKFGVTV